MAIQDRIAAAAAAFLEPGEMVQTAFVAQTASSWWVLLGFVPFLLLNQYRCVVVTDRRILVLDSGRLTSTKPKAMIRALSRSTRIGPTQGLWYVTTNLGETLRVHKRFHRDIEAADAAAGAAGPPPPPPPPA
ncbi:MAG: hypothetical protein JW785_02375 [Acidimicrobiia bacterium]|nr:hypothetical protein [Acidimicrobiia bacterium]